MVSRFLNWLKSWFIATPKIKFPRLPVHDPLSCQCCGRVIKEYTGVVCVACTMQADSMKITPFELYQLVQRSEK